MVKPKTIIKKVQHHSAVTRRQFYIGFFAYTLCISGYNQYSSSYIYLSSYKVIVMQHIELNQRQVSLQRIIKAQESRISELEAKHSDGNLAQKLKLEAAVKELTLKYQQKEKEFLQLKDEQVRYKSDLRESRQNMRHSRLNERDSLLSQNKSLNSKLKEMEDRIRNETQRNESDITKLLRMNQTLQKEVNFYKSSIASIEVEIQKLQIFYRSALVELPKRVDTLQWVDNFIRFMNQYEATLHQHPSEPNTDKIQKQLLDFKVEFGAKAKQMIEINNLKMVELQKVKEEAQAIIAHYLKQAQEVTDENQRFWEGIKKEKISKASQNERRLEEEVAQLKQQHSKQTSSLSVGVKALQQEKRDLNLAFLQLKSYYEHRQKSSIEEIKILKQNSEKLIQMGEKREETFQNEVSKLSFEVAEITRKYQENIRIPFEQFNKRFASDMRSIIQQIGNFPYKQKCGNILNRLQGRCRQAQTLIRRTTQRQTAAQQVISKHINHLKSLEVNLQKNIKYIIETIERYGDESLTSDFINQQEQMYDETITKLQLAELEARKNYDIDLLKHNNNRLQELVTRLQSQAPGTQTVVVKSQQSNTQVKMLKNLLEVYEKKFHQDLKKLRFAKYDKQVINVIADNLSKYEGTLQELKDYMETVVLPAIKSQTQQHYEYLTDIKTTVKEIQQFIEIPAKRLTQLVKYNEQVNLMPNMPRAQSINASRASETVQIFSNFKEEVKAYKQLLIQKEKPKANIGKTLSQLIQLLRGSVAPKQSLIPKQTQDIKTSRKHKPDSALQKRIRDIQSTRLKDKSELNTALEKLSKAIKKIETSKGKSKDCQQILSKTQIYLREKIEYIVGMLQYPIKSKQPSNEFNNVAKKALQDLQSKLKEAVYENQGLVKEFKLLTNFNQTFREGTESRRAE